MNNKLFNTSLIGSMPRGDEIMKARRMLKANMISLSDYEQLVYDKTKEVVKLQEDLDLSLIHI